MKQTYKQQREFLTKIGLGDLPHKEAIEVFQRAYNLGTKLWQDGVCGDKTSYAMRKCERWGYRISPNFKPEEFKCPHCGKWEIDYRVLRGLESARKKFYPKGLRIVSGYRCSAHNKRVGGTKDSLHMRGLACDIPGTVSVAAWKKGRVPHLNNLGYNAAGKIIHAGLDSSYKGNAYFRD